MATELADLERFARLLHDVERVQRVARRPDEREQTNTAEHSFELAMMCWYIASTNNLDFDFEKILRYALAHDIVEAYAGDTPAYDTEARKTKDEREAKALKRIKSEFPEFTDLFATIEEYERRETPEARFVYATDKLLDPLNTSMDTTSSIWKEHGVTEKMFMDYKDKKVAASEHIVPYWDELKKKLAARREFFFDN